MVNRARDQIRRELKRASRGAEGPGCSSWVPSPAQQLVRSEQAAAVLDAMGRLPPEQREAFVLHVQAGLAFRDIAAIQGAALRTVHSRYRYAIEKLRALLSEGTES